MSFQNMQEEFMRVAGQKPQRLVDTIEVQESTSKDTRLYFDLIQEEYLELVNAYSAFDEAIYSDERLEAIVRLSDGLADLLYVMSGLANTLGIPLQEIYAEVHRSNMTKFQRNQNGYYEILRREDGKVLKPDTYSKPNIEGILHAKMSLETALNREMDE